MIEALLALRIPGLWVTPVTEKYNLDVSCRVGGQTEERGWGLVELKGGDSEIEKAIAEIKTHPSVGNVTVENRQQGEAFLTVEVVHCPACEVLISSKSFLVFPVEIIKGWMKWLLVTVNQELGTIIEDLELLNVNFRIERIVKLEVRGVLTKRQEEVVRKALDIGYFDFPRKMDSTRLAQELDISVSTLSEIIRAAERRMFKEYFKE